jgi:hypothetical protein
MTASSQLEQVDNNIPNDHEQINNGDVIVYHVGHLPPT